MWVYPKKQEEITGVVVYEPVIFLALKFLIGSNKDFWFTLPPQQSLLVSWHFQWFLFLVWIFCFILVLVISWCSIHWGSTSWSSYKIWCLQYIPVLYLIFLISLEESPMEKSILACYSSWFEINAKVGIFPLGYLIMLGSRHTVVCRAAQENGGRTNGVSILTGTTKSWFSQICSSMIAYPNGTKFTVELASMKERSCFKF